MTEPYRVTKQSVSTMTSKSMVLDIIDRLVELFGLDTPEELEATCRENAPVVFLMSGEQAEQKFVYEFAETKHPLTRHQLGLVSYVYCLRSLEATLNQQPNEAWIYQSFAQHWLGVTVGAQAADGAVALANALRSKNAVAKKNERSGQLIAFARELAAKGNYKNASQAADGVLDEILAKGEAEQIEGYCLKKVDPNETNISLPSRVRRKIYEALLDMDFRKNHGS